MQQSKLIKPNGIEMELAPSDVREFIQGFTTQGETKKIKDSLQAVIEGEITGADRDKAIAKGKDKLQLWADYHDCMVGPGKAQMEEVLGEDIEAIRKSIKVIEDKD